jgi:hypothetical protein
MKIKLFMVVLLMVGLSACAHNPLMVNTTNVKLFKNFGVSLDPKPNQNTVKVTSKSQGWNKNNKKNGYVGFAKGETGWTFFGVKKEDLGDSCSGDATWVITQLLLSGEGDTGTEKGDDFGDPQPQWLQEAFPNIDLADGSLFKTNHKNEGVTFLPVFNANYQVGYKFIYYQLTLTRCSDGLPLTTDPGWGNGGRN